MCVYRLFIRLYVLIEVSSHVSIINYYYTLDYDSTWWLVSYEVVC